MPPIGKRGPGLERASALISAVPVPREAMRRARPIGAQASSSKTCVARTSESSNSRLVRT